MYTSYQLAAKYLHYFFTAQNGKGHGIHSPFVFDFVQQVLNNKGKYTPPEVVEKLRRTLTHNQTSLQIEDLGAGSRIHNTQQKTVKQLVKTAVKPVKYSQLLYRLVRHYQPKTIIELGTSLGITTAYLSLAQPSAQIITVEGSKAIYESANTNFKQLGLSNIEPLHGNFDQVLPRLLHKYPVIDMAYIDGNHRKEPTLRYFRQLLPCLHSYSLLVFDDIHWSAEMEEAWHLIQQHPAVQYTIDIFFLGFVFFRSEFKEKQHFTIRF